MIVWWDSIAAPLTSCTRHCSLPVLQKNAQGCIHLTLSQKLIEIFECHLLISLRLCRNHSRSGILGTHWMVQCHYPGVSMHILFCWVHMFIVSLIGVQYCCVQKVFIVLSKLVLPQHIRCYPFGFWMLNEINFHTECLMSTNTVMNGFRRKSET